MLEHIDDDNFQDFLSHPNAFLFIGKEDYPTVGVNIHCDSIDGG